MTGCCLQWNVRCPQAPATPQGHRRAWLYLLVAAFGALFLPSPVRGAVPESITRISVSQQFVAHGLPADIPLTQGSSPAVEYIRMDPNTAVVSCERIKQALLQELGLTDAWKGKIHIQLRVRAQDPDSSHITAMYNPEGWMYVVTFPEEVNRYRFLSTMIRVLLLEMANRRAGEVSAELPPWLAEGMAAHLTLGGLLDNLSEPYSRKTVIQRRTSEVESLRKRLRTQPPLTLNELNWPSPEHQTLWKQSYRDSAHLLVSELLRMKNGRERLGQFLSALHQHLNWQTTFFRVFQADFPRLVTLDKWWTMTATHFVGTEMGKTLKLSDAMEQLNSLLVIPLEVRAQASDRPLASTTSIQNMLSNWNPTEIGSVLTKRLLQLEALQWRTPPPLSALVQRYRQVLSFYLSQRQAAGLATTRRQDVLPNAKILLRRTLRDLDELDAERTRLAQELASTTSVPATDTPLPAASLEGSPDLKR